MSTWPKATTESQKVLLACAKLVTEHVNEATGELVNDPRTLVDLANVLRQLGRLVEAAALQAGDRISGLTPNKICNGGLTKAQLSPEARKIMERYWAGEIDEWGNPVAELIVSPLLRRADPDDPNDWGGL